MSQVAAFVEDETISATPVITAAAIADSPESPPELSEEDLLAYASLVETYFREYENQRNKHNKGKQMFGFGEENG